MEIDAGRLVLRPIGRDVARALLDGEAPEGVVLGPGYPSRFSLEVLEMVAGSRPGGDGGFGPYFMVRKADGAVVGEIGANLDGATAQVGYTVVEPSWGQGYATEALRALLAHLLADPRVDRVVADTLVGHTASRRVMEKAGMRLHGRRMGEVDGSLSVDLRPDQVALTLQSRAGASVTAREVALARRISEAAAGLGLATDPGVGGRSPRSVQVIEIGIDALDIAAVRPFWKAVLAYTDEPGRSGPEDPLVDPAGQGPAVWFQQMDAPRPQRNRIHLDVSVPHDEAGHRLRAALAAGGVLVSDAAAPAFWVLADPEGNEACITTWQGRDS